MKNKVFDMLFKHRLYALAVFQNLQCVSKKIAMCAFLNRLFSQALMTPITLIVFLAMTPISHAVESNAAITVDDSLLEPDTFAEWKTLETQHFNIHFLSRDKRFAQRVAAIAEKAHKKLSAQFQWQPARKTEVIINDSVDFPNGAATVESFNRFFIYMTPPVNGTLLTNHNWIELVFVHEYAHVLQLDQVGGVPERLRGIFGKPSFAPLLSSFLIFPIAYPEAFLPMWSVEGIAVYVESQSGFGRGNTGIFSGQMREELKRGFLSANEINYVSLNRWPFNDPYLYGAYFFKFVEAVYGEKKAFDFFITYRDEYIPYSLNGNVKKVFGKGYHAIWEEYLLYLEKHFKAQLTAIKKRKKNHGKLVEREPFLNNGLAPSEDGIFYYHNDLFTYPKIMEVNSRGEREKILRVRSVTDMDWHQKGGLLVIRSEVFDNTNLRNDVYLLSPEKLAKNALSYADLQRITVNARVHAVVWSNDGISMYATRIDGGVSQLVSIDLHGEMQVLHTFELGEVLGDLDLSADGKEIVAGIRRVRTGWNIEVFDLEKRLWNSIISEEGIESSPKYGSDNNDIYYLYHNASQVEVHRLHRSSKMVEVMTQTEGYVIEFALSKQHIDNQQDEQLLWLTKYTAEGQKIELFVEPKVIRKYRLERADFSSFNRQLPLQNDFNPDSYGAISDYSIFDNIGTNGWLPIFGAGNINAFGFFVNGQDTLGFHRWSFAPTYFMNDIESSFGGLFSYNFFNRFTLSASRLNSVGSFMNTNNGIDFSENETIIQAVGHYPLNGLNSSWLFSSGLVHTKTNRTFKGALSRADVSTLENLVGASVQYQSLFRNTRANEVSDGQGYSIRYESYDLLNNADFAGDLVAFNFRQAFSLAKNYSLQLAVDAGFGSDSIRPFELGGSFVFPTVITTRINPIGRRIYSFNGYQRNVQALSGNHFFKLSNRFAFPIANISNGFVQPPLGVRNIYGRIYSEAASAWTNASNNDLYGNAGIEVTTEILLGYDINLPLTLGFARGFDEQIGDSEFYLTLGF